MTRSTIFLAAHAAVHANRASAQRTINKHGGSRVAFVASMVDSARKTLASSYRTLFAAALRSEYVKARRAVAEAQAAVVAEAQAIADAAVVVAPVATARQRAYLADLGCRRHREAGLSRAEASRLIDEYRTVGYDQLDSRTDGRWF